MMNERIKKVLEIEGERTSGLVMVSNRHSRFSDGSLKVEWDLYSNNIVKQFSSFGAMEMDVLELGNDDEFMAMLEDDK